MYSLSLYIEMKKLFPCVLKFKLENFALKSIFCINFYFILFYFKNYIHKVSLMFIIYNMF